MKHLICVLDKMTGNRTISTPEGSVVEKKEPISVYTAHQEAWTALLYLYNNIENNLGSN